MLCEKAKISRSTYYCYYSDIDCQIEELEKLAITEVAHALNGCQEKSSFEKIRYALEKITALMLDWEPLSSLFLETEVRQSFAPMLEKELRPFIEEMSKDFSKSCTDEYYNYCCTFILSGVINTLCLWMHEEKRTGEEELCNIICQMINKLLR